MTTSHDPLAPMWIPDSTTVEAANVTRFMRSLDIHNYDDLYRFSIDDPGRFWGAVVDALGVRFQQDPSTTVDLAGGVDCPRWLPGAQLNIVESCFLAKHSSPAVVASRPDATLYQVSYGELLQRVQRVAASLRAAGFVPGDRLAILMPMDVESVVIYLGIVFAGATAVSIADSFAAPEIAKRLAISQTKAVFCCDKFLRGNKQIHVYDRVVAADAAHAIVITDDVETLRDRDRSYSDFLALAADCGRSEPAVQDPEAIINVLFSSGTTGDPKAIPWDQTVPIKCAADGHFHQDIRAGDVVCWPTNLGWMMGPWLIFATLINRGTIALHNGTPTQAEFGRFVEQASVTMLGVVPTIVRAWRADGTMEGFDWSSIRCFSSTGEASHPEDMRYLSRLAGGRPVIEYCGGTEVGGGYVTSTVVQPNVPGAFSTAALGNRFVILDEDYQLSEEGELFLIPPAMGLSTKLLNRDHHATYYEGVPRGPDGETLRRHGDHFRCLPNGYFQACGRVDDTMNLGGIKTSSAEIELVLNRLPPINETAAIAAPTDATGPDQLIVFVVLSVRSGDEPPNHAELHQMMNGEIKSCLNPLFKIARIEVVDSLPRTASNKVMRRQLRKQLAPG